MFEQIAKLTKVTERGEPTIFETLPDGVKVLSMSVLNLYAGHVGVSYDLLKRESQMRLRGETLNIKPCLRKLDDISEEECRDLFQIFEGYSWESGWDCTDDPAAPSCKETYWGEFSEVHSIEMSHAVGIPIVWLTLIHWGFDLFNLIDNQLALDLAKYEQN